MARRRTLLGERSQCLQHRLRTAAEQVRWSQCLPFQELRDVAVKAQTAVVRGKMDRRSCLAKILHARSELSAANPVEKGNTPRAAPRW